MSEIIHRPVRAALLRCDTCDSVMEMGDSAVELHNPHGLIGRYCSESCALQAQEKSQGKKAPPETPVWCRLEGWEVQLWRSCDDGKMVVQIDSPSDADLTEIGEPDGRIWLNDHLLHPDDESP